MKEKDFVKSLRLVLMRCVGLMYLVFGLSAFWCFSGIFFAVWYTTDIQAAGVFSLVLSIMGSALSWSFYTMWERDYR